MFFDEVYRIVRKIPVGKVATYRQIASLLGTRDARRIGHALYANKDSKTPCHRVVSKKGKLAENFAVGGYKEHKRCLMAEGVSFKDEIHVDLERHKWQIK